MHGRLKVRTSEEQALLKKKEQAKKVQAFRSATSKIFEDRKADEITQDTIDLVAKVLSSNPDISTLWNIRREYILLHSKELGDDEQPLFDKELNLTETCLQVNPKSYCAWHQRCWTLENCPTPNWQHEVKLCSKYLKIDERNFHCWDYRRYVAQKADVSAEDELKFCTEKIENNFSNYSSWHYRSKLLAELYPHPTAIHRPITEEILKKELDLVLEAAFTDPNDSSAWFYQRWLFGYAEAVPDLATFKQTDKSVLLSFSIPIDIKNFEVQIPWLSQQQNWEPVNPLKKYDTTWIWQAELPLPKESSGVVTLASKTGETSYSIDVKRVKDYIVGIKVPKFGYKFGNDIIDTMNCQLESCNSLLELEPDSKWTLLTASMLLRETDRLGNHSKIIEYLTRLQHLDPLRIGYYRDLTSKWNIEHKLVEWINAGNFAEPLKLSGLNLSTICLEQYLTVIEEIDFSVNQIEEKCAKKLAFLKSCSTINLNDNKLKVDDM